ncbi:hypothetical protein [Actinomadura sp. BRA 177]|uniref:hypothetical protein n=1 Tax=Actinomadura sp. BRA 177 TaxID=2745202 RepID=UPI001594F97C|nr:hypothetical protein [Actinomadura sp. BRA 177]NVI92805.1 hypothetical protein [Actinomadura sp. BRA 177]
MISIDTEGTGWEVRTVTADGTGHAVRVGADGGKVIRNDVKQEDAAVPGARPLMIFDFW